LWRSFSFLKKKEQKTPSKTTGDQKERRTFQFRRNLISALQIKNERRNSFQDRRRRYFLIQEEERKVTLRQKVSAAI